jgi:hypothetical protein
MYMWYISNYVNIYNFCVSQVEKAVRFDLLTLPIEKL